MDRPPLLETAQGTWEGAWKGPVAVFRGVRYAAAPVGELRWASPAPPPRFDGIRPAVEPGPACPQPPGWDAPYRAAARLAGVDPAVVAMDTGPAGEDCLRLDVWTPAPEPGARLPILFWIHGGASVFGSGSCALFDGTRLAAEHGVVVVSINYRLGVLGFLAHEELIAESPQHTAGNYGFLDQVAALEWVRAHAEALGGDPDRITVFGESAGGRAVFELLAHPPARGLFQRAIAQSPWDEPHHHRRLDTDFDGVESAVALGGRLAAELGHTGPGTLARLRETPTAEVLAAADRLGFPGSLWGPIVDGTVFPDHPLAMIARGESHAVPLVVGWNADEATIFFLGDLPFPTAETYRSWVESSHPEAAAELLALYPASDEPRALHRSFSDLYGDRTFVFPGLLAAKSLAGRTDVWVYHFTHVHPPFADEALAETGRSVGAYHAAEIPLAFGTLAGEPLDAVDAKLSRAMRTLWTSFAREGEPADPGVEPWPRFDPAEELYLELGDRVRGGSRPLADRYPALARALAPRLGLDAKRL